MNTTALPGVGRKDSLRPGLHLGPARSRSTFIFRIGGRSACSGPMPLREAHDELLTLVDPGDSYEFHMNLIRHGRELCRPKPLCGACELRRMCPYGRRVGSDR
jgi:endonuclease III